MAAAMRMLTLSILALSGLALVGAGAAFAEPSPLRLAAPASPNADAISDIYWVVFGVALGLFALVLLGLGGALVRGHRAASDLEPGRLAARTLGILAAIPVAGLVVIAAVVFARLSDTRDAPAAGAAGTLQVNVEARQAGWTYTYANGATATDRLRVPTGTTVRLSLTSADVTHSWWVPALGGQVRIFPGETATAAFRADRSGVFEGRSTVPSGRGYERMTIAVEALPQSEYDAWLEQSAEQKGGSNGGG